MPFRSSLSHPKYLLHYGKAQTEAELTLTPGAHTLCLQAADGNHVALEGQGMAHTIGITVE